MPREKKQRLKHTQTKTGSKRVMDKQLVKHTAILQNRFTKKTNKLTDTH